jgi:transcriptional regulator with XRE-family HTH domain
MPKMKPAKIDRAVGERIKFERERQGLTLDEMGKLCGASAQSMYSYEQGRTSLYLGRLAKIAKALRRSMNYFLREPMP